MTIERFENTSSFPLFDCSPEAKKHCTEGTFGVLEESPIPANAKYPFNIMEVGKSFTLSFEGAEQNALQNLRARVSQYNKTNPGKKFLVLRHKQYACFECVRIR